MNGMTLLTISAPGRFGVQAKRAIGLPAIVRQIEANDRPTRSGFAEPICRRLRSCRRAAISARTSSSMNLTENDDRRDRRRSVGGFDRSAATSDRGDDGGPAEKFLHQRAAIELSRFAGGRGDSEMRMPPFGLRAGAAAHVIDRRRKLGEDRVEPARIDAVAAEQSIDELVGGIGDEDEVVVEEILQPEADAAAESSRGRNCVADAANRLLGRGDAFQFAQDPLAVVGEDACEQALLVLERNLVGALRRGQHRDDDADDRDRDDHADRNHDAQPRAIPTGSVSLVSARSRDRCCRPTRTAPALDFCAGKLGDKACQCICSEELHAQFEGDV